MINRLAAILVLLLVSCGAGAPGRDLSLLKPAVAADYRRISTAMRVAGFPIFLVEGKRTCERQMALRDEGKSYVGCEGYHVHGRAFDVAFRGVPDPYVGPWFLYGALCEARGGTWGGRWETLRDYGHCEFR